MPARLAPADLARVAGTGLRTRRLRAALSALGIAIGVAAMVAVLGLSASSQAGLLAEIDRLGTECEQIASRQEVLTSERDKLTARIAAANSVAVIERSSSTGYHWFKARPVFDDRSKRWSADCRVGGEPGGPARVLFVAVMGRSGEAFREYYFRVGNETKQWPGITTLPPDIIVCDEVMVRRKEPRP